MSDLFTLMNRPENSPRDNLYYHLCALHFPHQKYLFANPHVNLDELFELVLRSPDYVRADVADKPKTPKVLVDILLFDEVPYVRIAAVVNPQTSFEVFQDAVLVDKYINKDKRRLAYHPYALTSLELFENLWKAKAGEELTDNLIDTLKKLKETNTDVSPILQSLMDFVSANIQSQIIYTRENYIDAQLLATAEAMDRMKDDKSKRVIESLSANPNLWTSTQRHLLTNHGHNYVVRKNLAKHIADNALLNTLYHEYKGTKSRKIVEVNPHFTLLPTPEGTK